MEDKIMNISMEEKYSLIKKNLLKHIQSGKPGLILEAFIMLLIKDLVKH